MRRSHAAAMLPAQALDRADPEEARRRFFLRALGLSVALHAALLGALPGPARTAAKAALPLLATLRLLAPAAPLQPVAPPAAETAPLRTSARRSAPLARPAQRSVVPGAPVAPAASHAATADDPAPEPAPASAQPAPAGAAPAPGAPDAAPLREANDALALERYGRTLSSLLARQHHYPRLAALRGWEGEVRVRVQVARKGAIVAVQLVRSSGFEILDQDALQRVSQAAPLPSPPQSLQEREFQIVVPILYRLDKAA